MNVTQDQVLSVVRWLITTAAGYALGKGWITSDQVTLFVGVGVAIVPLAWSIWTHSQSSQLRVVAAMPGVETIITNEKANDTLKSMAESKAPENAKIEPPKPRVFVTPKDKDKAQ